MSPISLLYPILPSQLVTANNGQVLMVMILKRSSEWKSMARPRLGTRPLYNPLVSCVNGGKKAMQYFKTPVPELTVLVHGRL